MSYCENRKELEQYIPLLLPHYSFEGEQTLFMQFRKKKVSERERELIGKINGIDTIEQVLEREGEFDLNDFLNLESNELILLQPPSPLQDRAVEGRKKRDILILAPHADDAPFSVGGTILKLLPFYNFHIVNIFARQDFTLYNRFMEKGPESNFIRKEERLAWRLMGVEQGRFLDYKDAPMRESYLNSEVISPDFSVTTILNREPELFEELKRVLENLLEEIKPDYTFCPLAIGRHIDHILVREACLQKVELHDSLRFYEDLPYAISFERERELCYIREMVGRELKEQRVEISSIAEQKKYILNIYKSQIKKFQVKAMIEYGKEDNERYFERAWKPV